MFLVLVLVLYAFSSIYADLLELKTGESLEGFFVRDSDKFIEFEENGIIKKIPKNKVKNLEFGYKGASFCYKLIGSEEICDAKLSSVDDKKIVISKGKGGIIKEEIPLKQLEYFKSTTIKKGDRISGIVKPKSKLQIKSKKGEWKGAVSNSDLQNGNLNLETDKENITLNESEIEEIFWKREEPSRFWQEFPEILLPGIYQWPRSKLIGGSMIFLLAGFGAMIPAEFNKAQAALNENQTILITNNRIYILSGLGTNEKFEKHKRNMDMAIAGVGLVISYHIYDVVRTYKNSTQDSVTRIEFYFTPVSLSDKLFPSYLSLESRYAIQFTQQF